MVNYKHLHYFWTVAKEGGISRASELLHITPQTISGQLSLLEKHFGVALFNKVGRNLEITEIGKQVLHYVDEIFSLGNELEQMMHQLPNDRPQVFRVGVFMAPTAIESEVRQQYKVIPIGQTSEITEDFYAISVEKRVLNPIASAVIESASSTLFSGAS